MFSGGINISVSVENSSADASLDNIYPPSSALFWQPSVITNYNTLILFFLNFVFISGEDVYLLKFSLPFSQMGSNIARDRKKLFFQFVGTQQDLLLKNLRLHLR